MAAKGTKETVVRPADVAVAERAALKLLSSGDFETERALARIAAAARRIGPQVYAELLWLLAHLRFDAETAARHWTAILDRRKRLAKKLQADVDVRVALVEYFLAVSRQLKNPTIIELKLFEQTQASVYRDALTGLYNYRYLGEHLEREFARAEREDQALSLVLFDIDDFKAYNDVLGHEAANKALTVVADVMNGTARTTDVVARYGGEEFVLVLSHTSKHRALVVAERIRSRVRSLFATKKKAGAPLTISGGVATYPIDGLSPDALLHAADQAMYVAKSRGKDQVFLFGDDRRSFQRINVPMEGSYRAFSSELRPFQCLDLSEGGMLIRAGDRLPLGSVLEMQFQLPRGRELITCVARVIRVEQRAGLFDTGVVLVNLTERDRHNLTKFIRAQAGAGMKATARARIRSR